MLLHPKLNWTPLIWDSYFTSEKLIPVDDKLS